MTQAAKVVSLKAVKADTVAPSNEVLTLSHAEVIKLAQSIASNYVLSQSSRATMVEACNKLFQAGIKLGKRKATKSKPACDITAAFLAKRYPNGLTAKGEPVSDAVLGNTALFFKRAVETGEAYNENATKTKGESKSIMIAFPKSAGGAEVASKLMAGFNKMKEANTQLADLAAFLIDALADAGFEHAVADAEIDAE